MILFQGSTGLTSGMSQENHISSNEGRCGFWPQHRWAQGFSKCSAFQSLALISLGLPSIPGKPVLWYLLLSPVITCVFTSLIDCGFYRAETKLYSSLKVSRGLTSCFMNEYWIEKCLLQHRSDQQLRCSGSWDLCLRSVEKSVRGQQRGGCVWGPPTWRLPMQRALNRVQEKKQSLTTRPSSPRGGGKEFSNTYTTCQEGPLQEDPLGH